MFSALHAEKLSLQIYAAAARRHSMSDSKNALPKMKTCHGNVPTY